MTIHIQEVKTYLNIVKDESDALLTDCLSVAIVLVNQFIGDAAVPETIRDRCVLIVTADLWERRKAPNGIVSQQYQSADGVGQAPARIARDPMAGAYALLRPWVMPL